MAKQDNTKNNASTNPENNMVVQPETTLEIVGSKQTEEDILKLTEQFDNQVHEPKEKTDQRDKVAADVFKNNPNCTKLFFTSDDIPFFAESDALKHARSLDDQTVVPKYKE